MANLFESLLAKGVELFKKEWKITPKTSEVRIMLKEFRDDLNNQIFSCDVAIRNRQTKWLTDRALKKLKEKGVSVFAMVNETPDYFIFSVNSTIPFVKLPKQVKAFLGLGSTRIIKKYARKEHNLKVEVKNL